MREALSVCTSGLMREAISVCTSGLMREALSVCGSARSVALSVAQKQIDWQSVAINVRMTSKWSAWRATATARPTRSEHSTAASGLARNPKPPPAQPTCGERGRGAVMSTCMHETQSRRPHSPPQTALARRRAPRTRARRRSSGRADRCVHSAAAKGTESSCQCQSMSISVNQCQSMSIDGN
jgi:hypothetical protein